MGKQEVEVFGRGKIALPVIAPGDHVHGASCRKIPDEVRKGDHPRRTRHRDSQPRSPEILDQWIRLHGIPTLRTARQDLKSPLK
jgi:hypothetical protein